MTYSQEMYNRLIEAAEDGVISWEDIAREALEQMNSDQRLDVAETFLDE